MARPVLTPDERIKALRDIVARKGKCSGLPCSSCPIGSYCRSPDMLGNYLATLNIDTTDDNFRALKLVSEARAYHAANLLAEDEMTRLLG